MSSFGLVFNLAFIFFLFQNFMLSELFNYPTSKNISYFWNLGSGLGLILSAQIFSGFLLTFFYVPSPLLAFDSSDFLSREVFSGLVLRVSHLNGASMFFFCLYLHISRGFFYFSFIQLKTWFSGVFIFFISMGIAFLGYVLPWGQMSFWGASVITNLIATVPIVGVKMVLWVWGGYNVNSATLSIFFSLHYILPFLLLIFVFLHLLFLHEMGSIVPQKNHLLSGKIVFGEYFIVKDLLNIPFIFFSYSVFFFFPWVLGDTENWIPANPMKSPVHIQPEWYFLFAYAILRSVPNKLGGVICLLFSILILFFLPFFNNWEQKPVMINWIFTFFLLSFLSLTWLGGCSVENPFILISQAYSLIYFSSFLLLLLL